MQHEQHQQKAKYGEAIINRKEYTPDLRIHSNSGVSYPTIKLHCQLRDEVIVLKGKVFSKFLWMMGFGYRKFIGSMYAKEVTTGKRGGQKIKKRYIGHRKIETELQKRYVESRTQQFQLLYVDGEVERITSEKYKSISHNFIQGVIENRLDAEGIEYEKTSKFNGMSGMYQFKNTDGNSEIANAISYLNVNSGDKPLHLFGGAVVLVCSNGMMSGKATSKVKVVHRFSEADYKRRIENKLSEILKDLTILPKQFMSLREHKVTKEEAEVLIHALPYAKYVKLEILARLHRKSSESRNGKSDWDGTMWGVYMAATYVGSHATELAKGNKTVEMQPHISAELKMVEPIQSVWEMREKLLESSKAKKIEAKA